MVWNGSSGPSDKGATEASRRRLRLAKAMVADCPMDWNLDIALTGSVSRSWADEHSDIELNAWGAHLPSTDERAAWLRAIGATEIVLEVEVTDEGTLWDRWQFHEVWVEAGWQSLRALTAHLEGVLRGDLLDHPHLMLTEAVAHALPLRAVAGASEHATLDAWRRRLAEYPDTVRDRLIASTLAQWDSPFVAVTRWAPVWRNQPLTITEELLRDTQATLRLLFALNREWEPDWKWIDRLSERLRNKPARLVERVTDCFGAAPAQERMRIATDLILDTLALLPPDEMTGRICSYLQTNQSG